MSYLNPLQFIEPPLQSLGEFEPRMLKKAKQRLLAEFELEGSGMMLSNGMQIDKQEALAMLEQLEEEKIREAWWEIQEKKEIAAFISAPNRKTLQHLPLSPAKLIPETQQILDPIVGNLISELAASSVREADWITLQSLLHHRHWFLPYLFDQIMKAFVVHLQQACQLLEEMAMPNGTIPDEPAILRQYCRPDFLGCINLLPDSHHELRMEFAGRLGDLAAERIGRGLSPQTAYMLLQAGASLKTSKEVQAAFRKAMDQISPPEFQESHRQKIDTLFRNRAIKMFFKLFAILLALVAFVILFLKGM